MLGDNLLPQSVQDSRRQIRSRLQDLRQPVKNARESIPGHDLIGKAENQFSSIRDQFLSRKTLMERIQELRSQQGQNQAQSGSGSNSSGGSSDTQKNNSRTMT